jgi:hypothetical protein
VGEEPFRRRIRVAVLDGYQRFPAMQLEDRDRYRKGS